MKKYLSYLPIILLLAILILTPISSFYSKTESETFSHFISKIEAGKVTNTTIYDEYVEYETKDKRKFRATPPTGYTNHIDKLNEAGVNYAISKSMSAGELFWLIVIPIIVFSLIAIVWAVYRIYKGVVSYRHTPPGAPNGEMGDMGPFGGQNPNMPDTRAHLGAVAKGSVNVRFNDIAGCHEIKEELKTSVDFLKNPKKYHEMGAEMPKGLILYGPPGTGKTLFARAIAGEADVPFFHCSASEFVEVYVGVGAQRVREIFEKARAHAPAVLFIDELDAIGKKRSSGRDSERDQTLNQILVEMDGFEASKDVMVVAATNRYELLDDALIRPGRFDRHLEVPLPNYDERVQIFNLHTDKLPKRATDIDLGRIAKKCVGFSGAQIKNSVNEASINAVLDQSPVVTQKHLDKGVDRIMYGTENKSKMNENLDELKNTAYHEAGHAILAMALDSKSEIDKITIIPRSKALGFVSFLDDGKQSVTRQDYLNKVCVCYGGRVGEEILLGEGNYTAGASMDIAYATWYIRSMVEKWGMGPFKLECDSNKYDLSEAEVETISSWVQATSEEQFLRAKNILEKNLDNVKFLAETLLDRETIYGDDLEDIMGTDRMNKISGTNGEF